MQHMKRRLNDITADILHIMRTLAISIGVIVPAEQVRQNLRGKWQKAGISKSQTNGINTPKPCSMATSGSAFLDLYKKKKSERLFDPPSSDEKVRVSETNEDVMMY